LLANLFLKKDALPCTIIKVCLVLKVLYLICWEVELSRMEQQAWKRELDAGAADGEKPKQKRKPKAKAKGKSKAKAKAKAKAKENKGQDEKTTKKKKKAQEETEDKTEKDEEAGTKKTKKKRKGKSTKDVKSETPVDTIATPPPKAPKTSTEGVEEQSREKGGRVKKTFAGRYRPKTPWGSAMWDALRAAWVAVAMVQLNAPSKLEAI